MIEQAMDLKRLLSHADRMNDRGVNVALMLSGHLEDPENIFRVKYPEVWPEVQAVLQANAALRTKLRDGGQSLKKQVQDAMVSFLRQIDPDLEVADGGMGVQCLLHTRRGCDAQIFVTGIEHISVKDGQFESALIRFEKQGSGKHSCTDTAWLYANERGVIVFDDQD